MSTIASVLKEEIARLARKEVTAGTVVLRTASAQHRRDTAQLRRQVDAPSKQVTYFERLDKKRAKTPVPVANIEVRRFSRRGSRTHRRKVDLSAADYAELVGVTAQTTYSWEQGNSKPRDEQLASLLAVRDLGKHETHKRLDLLED